MISVEQCPGEDRHTDREQTSFESRLIRGYRWAKVVQKPQAKAAGQERVKHYGELNQKPVGKSVRGQVSTQIRGRGRDEYEQQCPECPATEDNVRTASDYGEEGRMIAEMGA